MADASLAIYSLKGLPFELARLDVERVGRALEWERLLQIIALSRNSRSPIMGVLLGTYGAGKTFMLWQLANALKPATKSKILSSGPIRLIDPEQKRDFTRSLVLRFFSKGIDIENQLL